MRLHPPRIRLPSTEQLERLHRLEHRHMAAIQGPVRHVHFGEGDYGGQEKVIQALLDEKG